MSTRTTSHRQNNISQHRLILPQRPPSIILKPRQLARSQVLLKRVTSSLAVSHLSLQAALSFAKTVRPLKIKALFFGIP